VDKDKEKNNNTTGDNSVEERKSDTSKVLRKEWIDLKKK